MTNEKWYPICMGSGSFFTAKGKRDIPEFIKDIGLGASLYLLNLKALGKIFLALTIFNIPALYCFYSGTESEFRELRGMSSIFAKFSLGNLGE
jgi:hypothetical protein